MCVRVLRELMDGWIGTNATPSLTYLSVTSPCVVYMWAFFIKHGTYNDWIGLRHITTRHSTYKSKSWMHHPHKLTHATIPTVAALTTASLTPHPTLLPSRPSSTVRSGRECRVDEGRSRVESWPAAPASKSTRAIATVRSPFKVSLVARAAHFASTGSGGS